MKKISKSLAFFMLLFAFVLNSCNKDKNDYATSKGQIQFSFAPVSELQKSDAKTVSDGSTVVPITAAIVTITDASGNVMQNAVQLNLSNMNGNYISTPLALVTGNYLLTEYALVNQSNQVMYASPLKSSKLAYLVSDPLPISFSVQTNAVTNVAPEVLSTANYTPQDFGYATFSFNIDSTFNFLIGAFIYNSSGKNYQLTTASISIYGDSALVYTGKLGGTTKDSVAIISPSDSLGFTNNIALPAKYNYYKVVVSKANYVTYVQTFTKAQLRQYYISSNKGPLIVILNNSTLLDGLVAYYPFNGDVLDYSGNNNNGVAYGTITPTTDHKGNPNGAFYFNGIDSYVDIPDAPSLNPTAQITISAWFNPISFVGCGYDALVSKVIIGGNIAGGSNSAFSYQYKLGVTGNEYWNTPEHFGFALALKDSLNGVSSPNNSYTPGNWFHIVCTYDGTFMKIYVNGIQINSLAAKGSMKDYGQDINIGRFGYVFSSYGMYYLPGSFGEIRIYNRALSATEITTLYQQ